jgi:PDZ domain/Aspartyl protease
MNGAALRRIGQITATGSTVLSGLRGTARFDDDLTRGRYAQRFDVAVVGASSEIFDGTTVWVQDISGGVHALDADFPRRHAVTSAYLTSRAYLDPASPARLTCSVAGDGSGAFVVRAQPSGGTPVDLRFGATSHLLESTSERLPTTTQVTRYDDYRRVADVVLPYEIRSGTLAEPADGFDFEVHGYRFAARPQAGDFARPRETRPAVMLGGATSSTVPAKIEGRQLFVWASINGHAPMPFILDTGGHAILTTGAAKTLGLRGSGAGESGGSGAGTIALQYTRARSIRLGQAQLNDQPLLIIPYPFSFWERGKREPLAGILGLEVFEKFAVRIDYAHERVTFAPLRGFAHPAGAAVALRFEDDTPLAAAAADGHAGDFQIDTGNAGSTVLYGPFLQRTGLLAKYVGGVSVRGFGTGGSNTGRLQTLRSLEFGGHDLTGLVADFTQMKSGAFSSLTEAGNLGYDVLWRYVPTFDYANQTLYLGPSPDAHAPPKNSSGLGAMKAAPGEFQVFAVRPGSLAARAGIVAGDRIVGIDGRPATDFSTADLGVLLSAAPGTRVALRVRGTAQTRDVTLVLR